MKALKIVVAVALAWVGLVVVFESLLAYFQPRSGETLVITTYDEEGDAHARVVSRLESGGELYVAANHWPRAWYRRALEHPEVEVTLEGEPRPYRAVPVEGEEYARVNAEHALPLPFRILTGFPPRELLRLEPRERNGTDDAGAPDQG